MRPHALIPLLLVTLVLSGCGRRNHSNPKPVAYDRLASLVIEVYDPDTNSVWEGVSVRIVEVEHEWSGRVVPNPIEDDWYVTGRDGTIEFTPKLLGMTNVGFFEDPFGRAVMSPDLDQDEAIVLIEVYGEGLGSAFW